MGLGGFRADRLVHPVFKEPADEQVAGLQLAFRVWNGSGKGELGGSRQGRVFLYGLETGHTGPVFRRGTVLITTGA
ncbi:hypothetical protein NCCP2145_37510 [Pseudarthrobacter sp. NCCP-2145]|nr:hypothetical protein NCCP2145_37510 [Pseudarthrobacter sp. NCCP-2145]